MKILCPTLARPWRSLSQIDLPQPSFNLSSWDWIDRQNVERGGRPTKGGRSIGESLCGGNVDFRMPRLWRSVFRICGEAELGHASSRTSAACRNLVTQSRPSMITSFVAFTHDLGKNGFAVPTSHRQRRFVPCRCSPCPCHSCRWLREIFHPAGRQFPRNNRTCTAPSF